MIKNISIKSPDYEGYHCGESIKSLQNLNKINIFIGPNNSGKSRFLRTLFKDDEFEVDLINSDFKKISNYLSTMITQTRNLFDRNHVQDADSLLENMNVLLEDLNVIMLLTITEKINKVRKLSKKLISLNEFNKIIYSSHPIGENPIMYKVKIQEMGYRLETLLNEEFGENFKYDIHKIYIPILRGLRTLSMGIEPRSEVDHYKQRTIRDYFPQLTEKIDKGIFTGNSLYMDTKKLLLGNKTGREKIKKFEDFLSRHFFGGQSVSLIPDIDNDVLLIGIGQEERLVHELGDGIQSLIILLYPLFFNQDKTMMVFIEEPEASLHPGFQRVFLETLMREEFKNFQFFITTHSNHFLDITLDLKQISVYTFQKANNEQTFSCNIENTSSADIRILDLLGARNSAVFLSNCTIWVEGITDRLYLKKYLEVYQQDLLKKNKFETKFLEDIHFSFVEYAGGNIVHWGFDEEVDNNKIKASRISNKIYLLADQDSTDIQTNSAKAKRLEILKTQLKDRFRVINGREIENTLHEAVLIKTLESLNKKNDPAIEFDNNLIMNKNYSDVKLGEFIELNFRNLTRKYSAPSGTIQCKMDFCRTAIDHIHTVHDLSAEGLSLAKDIFQFIYKENK